QVDAASGRVKAESGGAGVELYVAGAAFEEASRAPAADAVEGKRVMALSAGKIADTSFVGGFGSMGGEEFISYMNVSDSLVRAGGDDWKKWNGKIKEHLVKLQNQDGTWAGHHCIT